MRRYRLSLSYNLQVCLPCSEDTEKVYMGSVPEVGRVAVQLQVRLLRGGGHKGLIPICFWILNAIGLNFLARLVRRALGGSVKDITWKCMKREREYEGGVAIGQKNKFKGEFVGVWRSGLLLPSDFVSSDQSHSLRGCRTLSQSNSATLSGHLFTWLEGWE